MSDSDSFNLNPRALNAPIFDIVDLARHIQMADDTVKANTTEKLLSILERIRILQAEARQVLSEASRDAALHRAACGIVKRPGQLYHLYMRADGTQLFSIVAPTEWGTGARPFSDAEPESVPLPSEAQLARASDSNPVQLPNCPYKAFLGTYRLEQNMKFTPLAELTKRDADVQLVRPLVMLATNSEHRLEFKGDSQPLLAIASQIASASGISTAKD